jgi:hypothetical protein
MRTCGVSLGEQGGHQARAGADLAEQTARMGQQIRDLLLLAPTSCHDEAA